MRHFVTGALASTLLMIASPTFAESATLGVGHFFVNDFLGDGHDRWRTGSFAVSLMFGRPDASDLPDTPGALTELRLRTEIIAPRHLNDAGPFDRPYVGELTFGAHTQFQQNGLEYSLGLDIVAVGKATGVSSFQRWFHENLLGMHFSGLAPELPNAIYPTVSAEVAKTIPLSPAVAMRAFGEVQAGVETFVRVGADLSIGDFCSSEVRVRDTVTGFRYKALPCDTRGRLFAVVGADVTSVLDSNLLPASPGLTPTPVRRRLRVGFQFEGQTTDVFYGVTWLSKEFEQQKSGQIVGALNINFKF